MAELQTNLLYQFPDPVFSLPPYTVHPTLVICNVSKGMNYLLHSLDSPLIQTLETEKEGSSKEVIAFDETSFNYG